MEVLEQLAGQVKELVEGGRQVIVVSSGAIIAGLARLGWRQKPLDIARKQAAAAVGQPRLLQAYEQVFGKYGIVVAQILLTRDDLISRRRYLNARNTLFALLQQGIVPVVNENDTVVVEEIKFGDNDNLSALVASLVEADLLVILSDIEGLYTADPNCQPGAQLLHTVERITPEIERMSSGTRAQEGTGGMVTKLQAAQKAGSCGIPTVVACGRKAKVLQRILAGEEEGTIFLCPKGGLRPRKHWIAHVLKPKGRLVVDDGAQAALVLQGKSLLPSGITAVKGEFQRGDAVSVVDGRDREFARGLVNYSAAEVGRILGCKTSQIEEILGYKYSDEVIHRDNLVLVGEETGGCMPGS